MKFGTSGLRGLVVDLLGHPSQLYATAFAEHLLRNGIVQPGDRIFIGEDFRPSSPDIAAGCIGALQRAGLKPVRCGALPTPALALYAMSNNSASLMVTGSHIPADRNGIKFYRPDGEIDKQDEQSITRIAEEIRSTLLDLTPGIAADEEAPAKALFEARCRSILPAGALNGLKIGVYQHSTVARDILGETLAFYGAQVVPLGWSDTFIPVDTEAVSPETIEHLKRWTAEHGLDAIVSADGDGDRPLVSDERGEPLRGDLLGLLAAQFLGAQVLVTPVTSNSGLEQAGDYAVMRTRVGSPYVIEAMQMALADGKAAVLGFEANGGTLMGSDFEIEGRQLIALPTRDSVLPVLAALFRLRQEGKPLSAVAADIALPCALADRLENFAIEASRALMTHLDASSANLGQWLQTLGSVKHVDRTDGLRVTLADDRIIHLRPSGNAPEMRCYVEAATREQAQTLLDGGLALLRGWTG